MLSAEPGRSHADSQGTDLERLVRYGLIETYFSPVIDLATDRIVGHQITHGNAEEPTFDAEQSRALRAAIRDAEFTGDIDASLRATALREAEAMGLPASDRIFIHTEPESLVALEDRTGEPDRSAVLQLSPETIAASPASTLRAVRQARQLGWGIGMTGIGVDLASTAFLPLVNPSVVTLHEDVLDISDGEHIGELIRLLHAHVERTEALVMIEGVRDAEDEARIRDLGVRLATGPRYGEPSRTPTPADPDIEDVLAGHFTRNALVQGTPYSIAQGLKRDSLTMGWKLVHAIMCRLEERALVAGEATVVIGVFSDREELLPDTVERYERLAASVGYTVMVSGGFDFPPVEAARGGSIDPSDPLRNEFAVIVVGPDWSGLIAAHRRAAPGRDGRVEYDVYVTTDRYTCVDSARAVLGRIRSLL